jgi:hypothetical protein
MGELDLTRAQWSKNSYSSANGACVEVAQNCPGSWRYETPRIPTARSCSSHPPTGEPSSTV